MPNNKVSLDRITVSGTIREQFRELQGIMNALGSHWELSEGVFRLMREFPNGDTENVAYYAENAFKRGSWRLDFNPNKLSDEEKSEMIRAINLLIEPHFTRLDVAFDVFNDPTGMKYRVYRQNVSERVFGVYKGQWEKDVQTIYYGSVRSEIQIRQYNKLVERRKKQEPVPADVEHWMRLELQLIGKKPSEWVQRANDMLADFRLPNYDNIENKTDRMTLFAIENELFDWSDFKDNNKKARLRKLQHEQYDDTLAKELLGLLTDNQERLYSELRQYLADFGISK